MTTKRAGVTSSLAKDGATKPAKPKLKAAKAAKHLTKKSASREQTYRDVFAPPSTFLGPDEFMPQVNGYGTPTYAAVGSFAGV